MKIIKKIFLFYLTSVSAAFNINIPTINLHNYLNPALTSCLIITIFKNITISGIII